MFEMKFFLLACVLFYTNPAVAYIGPGLGGGTLAVIGGILISICLAVFAIIYYPIKKMLKGFKTKSKKVK
jgi:hypothetical protein